MRTLTLKGGPLHGERVEARARMLVFGVISKGWPDRVLYFWSRPDEDAAYYEGEYR